MKTLSTIHTNSIEALGSRNVSNNQTVGSYASATYPAANRALYIPFVVSEALLVRQLFVANGATTSGAVDMGIYDAFGTRLISTASTAQTGTSVLQVFDITDTWIGPGKFFFGVALDNTVGTMARLSIAVGELQTVGVAQQATAFPLPATAVFANPAATFLPLVGLSTRTTV